MPEITPEQRVAAWQAIRKWTAAIGSEPQDPDYAIDALIAEGWGPVADAEARGQRAGLGSARLFARLKYIRNQAFAVKTDAPSDQYLAGYGTACRQIMEDIDEALSALADKPKEGSDV